MAFFSSHSNFFLDLSPPQENTEPEKWPSLVLLPILGTGFFYLLPDSFQQHSLIQFFPQFLAYLGFGIWAYINNNLGNKLGIQSHQLAEGLKWGGLVGLTLGICNTIIILKAIPAFGGNITFLTQTPHAQTPTYLMLPWVILAIAIAVEFNFRGFVLGRLSTLLARAYQTTEYPNRCGYSITYLSAIMGSALLFALDPFMVMTFQHLHWIALWDGMIWGVIWMRHRNLYTVITAHAIEVILMYTCIKMTFT